jgi:hypothetical protein
MSAFLIHLYEVPYNIATIATKQWQIEIIKINVLSKCFHLMLAYFPELLHRLYGFFEIDFSEVGKH